MIHFLENRILNQNNNAAFKSPHCADSVSDLQFEGTTKQQRNALKAQYENVLTDSKNNCQYLKKGCAVITNKINGKKTVTKIQCVYTSDDTRAGDSYKKPVNREKNVAPVNLKEKQLKKLTLQLKNITTAIGKNILARGLLTKEKQELRKEEQYHNNPEVAKALEIPQKYAIIKNKFFRLLKEHRKLSSQKFGLINRIKEMKNDE